MRATQLQDLLPSVFHSVIVSARKLYYQSLLQGGLSQEVSPVFRCLILSSTLIGRFWIIGHFFFRQLDGS